MMPDRDEVIRGLECVIRKLEGGVHVCDDCPYDEDFNCLGCSVVLWQALALLREQEQTLKQVAENFGLTVDGVEYALRQYQIILCEITHGALSKLSYDAQDVIRYAQDRWCETCDLKSQQEASGNA